MTVTVVPTDFPTACLIGYNAALAVVLAFGVPKSVGTTDTVITPQLTLALDTNLAADVAKLDVHQGGHLSLNIELFSVASSPEYKLGKLTKPIDARSYQDYKRLYV